MRYAGLMVNDSVDCKNGLCVSYWFQGCPHHCPGCHNPQTWDFSGGAEVPPDIIQRVIDAIGKYDIKRNFSLLGGEPLCPENFDFALKLCKIVKATYPDIIIYCWTGYTWEELIEKDNIEELFSYIDILIEGRFIQEKRDITLSLRGSSNQRIIYNPLDKLVKKQKI